MKADRSLQRIISRFDLELRDIRRVKRGVYQLTTRTGEQLCLKRMGYTEERLMWMDQTLGEMRKAGFRDLAWRDPQTRIGKRLFVKADRKDAPYILTPWLQGRLPSSRSAKDMFTVSKALARFHKTSHSIRVSDKGMDNWLGQWPSRLQERATFLQKHIDRATQRVKRQERPSAMNQLLAQHGDRLLRRTETALHLLKKSDYRERCKRAARQLTVCHGDSGPKNFVLTKRGAYLIDFETLRVDLRVYDLYRMIRLSCKENKWDVEMARAILNGYRSVSPLEAGEYDLLLVWLIFPQKAYRTLARYDRTQGSQQEALRDKLVRKLRRSMEEDSGLVDFVKGLQDYMSKE